VRPGSDMAANPVQDRDVSSHQFQDFGGIRAVRAVALDIDQPAQLVGGRPSQPGPNTATLQSEHGATQERDALARWDMCDNCLVIPSENSIRARFAS
jgi:hypothetical protein